MTVSNALPAANDCPNPTFCTVTELHTQQSPWDGGCWGRDHVVALNLMLERGKNVHIPKVEVVAHGPVDEESQVHVLIGTDGDELEFAVTADEARRIARHLLTVADEIDHAHGGDGR